MGYSVALLFRCGTVGGHARRIWPLPKHQLRLLTQETLLQASLHTQPPTWHPRFSPPSRAGGTWTITNLRMCLDQWILWYPDVRNKGGGVNDWLEPQPVSINPLICAATQEVVRLCIHAISSRTIPDRARGGTANYMMNTAEGHQCMTNPPRDWTHH